jgi:hypothetical protein
MNFVSEVFPLSHLWERVGERVIAMLKTVFIDTDFM